MNVALVVQFARQDLVDRYAGSLLGGLWTFVQPLSTMLVFILVFSRIMGARLPEVAGPNGYSIYLISALLGWVAFSSTLLRTTTVFMDRANVITKVRLSLWTLPLSIVLSDTIVFAISMAFFLTFLVIVDHPLTIHFLWVPLVFAVQQAFAYSLGMILACLSVFLRDIRESVAVVNPGSAAAEPDISRDRRLPLCHLARRSAGDDGPGMAHGCGRAVARHRALDVHAPGARHPGFDLSVAISALGRGKRP